MLTLDYAVDALSLVEIYVRHLKSKLWGSFGLSIYDLKQSVECFSSKFYCIAPEMCYSCFDDFQLKLSFFAVAVFTVVESVHEADFNEV